MRTYTICLLAIGVSLLGCVDSQEHGDRPDSGGLGADSGPGPDDAGPLEDGGSRADAGPVDDAAAADDAGGGPDASGPESFPPFLDISVTSTAHVETEDEGGVLEGTQVNRQRIMVRGFESLGSETHEPTGTVGPCDLYPPVGAGSWPPTSGEAPVTTPVPPEHVTITADGAALDTEAAGDAVMARSELDVGSSVVVTVRYPDHAPLRREVVIAEPLAVTSPANEPSATSPSLYGSHTRGDDLAVTWPVEHDADAAHTVDVTGGSLGAARCELEHADGTLTLSASDLENLLGASDPSLSLSMFASTFEDEMVDGTQVRTHRNWSMPSVVLTLE